MKRFLILLSLLFCNMVFADTINLHWLNYDGTSYQDSTCVIDSDLILPSAPPTKYGYTFTGWKLGNYQPIEYLESTGGQMIDTGVKGNLSTNIIADFTPLNFSTVGSIGIVNTSNNFPMISVTLSGNNNERYSRFGGDNAYISTRNVISLNTRYTIEINREFIKLNGNTIGRFNQTQTFVTSNMFLLNSPTSNSNFSNFSARFYSCRIYDNNTLVRDFIPVLDENGTPCMFDRVTQQFYYNAGTGQFIAGPTL